MATATEPMTKPEALRNGSSFGTWDGRAIKHS